MTDHTTPATSALSGVLAPHGVCVFCGEGVYQVDDDSPARQEEPPGGWATLATGTSCPFRDEGGHAVYREDKPLHSIRTTAVGGDAQVGESWSRSFVRPLPDGQSAAITVYFYIHDERRRTGNSAGGEPVLTRLTEFAVYRDLDDIDGVEEQCTYTQTHVPESGQAATEDAARRACDQVDAAMFTWDGIQPVHRQQIR